MKTNLDYDPDKLRRKLNVRDLNAYNRLVREPSDFGSKVLMFSRIARSVFDNNLSLAETARFLLAVSSYGSDSSGTLFPVPVEGSPSIDARTASKMRLKLVRKGLLQPGGKTLLGSSYSTFEKGVNRANALLPKRSKKTRHSVAQVVADLFPDGDGDDRWRDVFRCLPSGTVLSQMEWALFWMLYFSSTIHGTLDKDRAEELVSRLKKQWFDRDRSVDRAHIDAALSSLEAKGLIAPREFFGKSYLMILNAAGKTQIEFARKKHPTTRFIPVYTDSLYDERHAATVFYKELAALSGTRELTRAKTMVEGFDEYGKLVAGINYETEKLTLLTPREVDDVYASLAGNTGWHGLLRKGADDPTLESVANELCAAHLKLAEAVYVPTTGIRPLATAVLFMQADVPLPTHVADALVKQATSDYPMEYSSSGLSDAALAYVLEKHELLTSVRIYQPGERVPFKVIDVCARLVSKNRHGIDLVTGNVISLDG